LLAKHADCKVVRNLDEMNAAASGPGRLLGIFASGHVPFELDRKAGVPTLSQMTKVALDRLDKAPNGFVLQVEGGRIDHAAHNNDAPSLIAEQLAFDDAIAEVMKFVEGRDDTLVILTTDHGNANPGLTLYGARSFTAFDRNFKATASSDMIYDQLAAIKDKAERFAKAPEIIEKATSIALDATELKLLERAINKERVAPFAELNDPMHVISGLLSNYFGVSFVSGNHTADMVEVTALGPGSQNLRPFIDNIDLHGMMVDALGLPEAKLLDGMDAPMKPVPVKTDD
ncbi:MAG: alkaline phosphatase, partial [Planctomycetota bacterium]